MPIPRRLHLAALLSALVAPPAIGGTLFVDDTATGNGSGADWSNAMPNLRDALNVAQAGDEVWVAEGTYRPDLGGGASPGDRTASFHLPPGVRVYGGFAGIEATLAQRAGHFDTTVLSGDLAGDDGSGAYGENSLHVVTGTGADAASRLDGFTITGGNANVSGSISGGGMLIDPGSPVVRRCTFLANRSLDDGAGVTILGDSNPAFVECVFLENDAGDVGGAVWTSGTPTPSFVDCAFLGNVSGRLGGAIYQFQSSGGTVTITGCAFSGNRTVQRGGAIYVSSGTTDVVASTFSSNGAGISEGGVKVTAQTRFRGSILWANTAPNGTTEQQQFGGNVPAGIDHCCIQGFTGSVAGAGNLAVDPMFADADGPDGVVGTLDDDLGLDNGSPCLDAGDNGAIPADAFDVDEDGDTAEPLPRDLAGGDRFFDAPGAPDTGSGTAPIVDIGALEGPSNPFVVAYGNGCPGAGGFTPVVSFTGFPASGNPIVLGIDLALGGSTAVVLFGAQQTTVPIGAGCSLHVAPVLPLQLTIPLGGSGPGNGSAILPAVVPPGAAGAVLTMQAFVADASSPTGFSTSSGLEVTFQ